MAEVSTIFVFCQACLIINFPHGVPFRVVEDFRDWTNWLLYRGGIGVKGEESWEAWWEEELVIRINIF